MPASYSLDLRTRIAQEYNDNGNAEQVALLYDVSVSSVRKFARLYRENDLAPKSTDPKRLPLILDSQLNDLRVLVKEFSDYKLTQYCDLWFKRHGVQVSRSVMDRAMTRAGITFKKRLAWRLKKKPLKT
jgi:transposase